MSSLSQLGATFVKDMRSQNREVVSYTRGAVTSSVFATVGERRSEAVEGGLIVESRHRDFIINVEDLVLEGDQLAPSVYDEIAFDGEIYVVTAPPGQRCFEYHDRFKNSYRIHTVENGTSS